VRVNRALVARFFTVVDSRCTADEVVIICPDCAKVGGQDLTGNRSVNVKTGLTSCWKCGTRQGHSGLFEHWAKKYGYDGSQAEQSAASIDELEDELSRIDDPVGKRAAYFSDVRLPRGFTRLEAEPDSVYARYIVRMAVRKRLTLEDFVKAGVGFTRDDPRWEPFAIFPAYEYSRLAYFQGRTYVDVPGENTKKNPLQSECRFGSSYWVYNIDRARDLKPATVVVVESIFNVLSLERELEERGVTGVVPVALFGHKLSKIHAVKLRSLRGVKEVCFIYDSDAYEDALMSARHFVNAYTVTAVKMPPGQDANDDAKLAVNLFEKRKPVDPVLVLEDNL
jgi:hypothetical protein